MSKPMRVYYDFEFLEDYKHIDPISLGMVRADGRELYMVFNDFDTLAVANHDWLMKNVMTSIGHIEHTSHVTGLGTPVKDLIITDDHAICKSDARAEILAFVSDIWPEFWAWYGAYDHVALCSLFGRMVDLPARFPMFTNDIRQLYNQAGKPEMPKQPSGLHNALEDAKFNVVRYNFLMAKLEPTTWVISEVPGRAIAWARQNLPGDGKWHAIAEPDQLRGLILKKTDSVVVLSELSPEMEMNLRVARRG